MGNLKIDPSEITDMTNAVSNVSVAAAATGQTVYPEWSNPKWAIWYGYYKGVPELKAVIDNKAAWTVGKGYKSETNKEELGKIRGMGKDTFNDILKNAVKTYTVGGDFFAEIVRTDRTGKLLNLKPLSPDTIKIKGNRKHIIARYEQRNPQGETIKKYEPSDIFHLPWNRMSSDIHGQSTVESIESTILSFNEAFADMKTIFHRYVKPLIISVVDTDNASQIAAYKAKLDKAVENGENMVVPKGTLDSMERVSIPQYSTLDPLPWIQQLHRRFIIAEGVPEIIMGHASSTGEGTAKILYLAFQQTIEANQKFIEEHMKAQLDIEIKLEFPASLEPAMQATGHKTPGQNNFQMGQNAKK